MAIGHQLAPPLEIARQYLNLASGFLKGLVKTEATPLLKTFSAFPDALDTILSSLESMNLVVFNKLALFARCFDSFFLTTREPTSAKVFKGEGLDLVKELFWVKIPIDVFVLFLNIKVRHQLEQELKECLTSIENEYFEAIGTLLKLPVIQSF